MMGVVEKKETNLQKEINAFVSSLQLYSSKFSISSLRQKIAKRLHEMIENNRGVLILNLENCKKVEKFLEKHGVKCRIVPKGELAMVIVQKESQKGRLQYIIPRKLTYIPKTIRRKSRVVVPYVPAELSSFFKDFRKKPYIEYQDMKAIMRVRELIEKNDEM